MNKQELAKPFTQLNKEEKGIPFLEKIFKRKKDKFVYTSSPRQAYYRLQVECLKMRSQLGLPWT